MSEIEQKNFGVLADGSTVRLFTLRNSRGMSAKVMTYGGILTELWVPDRNGKLENVVLGFDNLEQYLKGHPFFGAITGRVANRIAKGRFTLDGTEYKLAINNGPNSLHGGLKGFDKVNWQALPSITAEGHQSLQLTYRSKDGEEGFPGNLDVTVTYTVTAENELQIDYEATTDKASPINLTNHSYFNLAGKGTILEHEVALEADNYTPVNEELIPTGQIASVKGTPLDFTQPRKIGERIAQLKPNPGGYDHNFVLNSGGKSLALAARVKEVASGRVLEVYTTEPGIQLYTGNFLDGKLRGAGGNVYEQHTGFCLETQHFPDSVNQPNFPSTILRPGETYRSRTVFKFAVG